MKDILKPIIYLKYLEYYYDYHKEHSYKYRGIKGEKTLVMIDIKSPIGLSEFNRSFSNLTYSYDNEYFLVPSVELFHEIVQVNWHYDFKMRFTNDCIKQIALLIKEILNSTDNQLIEINKKIITLYGEKFYYLQQDLISTLIKEEISLQDYNIDHTSPIEDFINDNKDFINNNKESNKRNIKLTLYDENNSIMTLVSLSFVNCCITLKDLYDNNEDLCLPRKKVSLSELNEIMHLHENYKFSESVNLYNLIDVIDFLNYKEALDYIIYNITINLINERKSLLEVKDCLNYYPTQQEKHNLNIYFFKKYYNSIIYEHIFYI